MNIHQLRYFVRVAEHGSFTAAAAMIPVAQSALSRHVRGLEDELGQALFYRNGRGVNLTAAGQKLLVHARAILKQIQDAKDDLARGRNEVAGRVCIGLPPSISRSVSAPLIIHCKGVLPDVLVTAIEGHSINIIEWELSGRIDIGLVYDPPASSAYHSVPLLETQLYLISAAKAPPAGLSRRGAVTLRQLAGLPLILPSAPHSIRALVDAECRKHRLPLTLAREVEGMSGMATILDLVESGEGCGILPLHSSLTESHRLRRAFAYHHVCDPVLALTLHMIVPANRSANPLIHRLADLLRAFVPERIKDVEHAARAAIGRPRRAAAKRTAGRTGERRRARSPA